MLRSSVKATDIDAFSMPYATPADIAELFDVVESIRFED